MSTTYRGYLIYFDPPPIPRRDCDWHFVHRDYDGAEDSRDNRCGSAPTMRACIFEIDAIEAERAA